jgi:hypothetical protein
MLMRRLNMDNAILRAVAADFFNWFLVIPSIATKFQYITPPFFYFPSLTTCFGPYGPSSGEIYN